MSAKHDTKSPTQFHSAQELRDEMDKLKRELDAVEALMNAKLMASYAGHPGYAPKRKEAE